ncbi:valine--tRNA ligase [Tautonia plasticadhaerens]|uniref:Valine--tRNA ligase n=1 Tax=Tautonia plasticadhaerens TaxID=2527974 RepID=A0A518H0I1_9BACT|nr:valine--tRNA ligase [Tautonia plasticadhaerens]QDV34338.1 Valine--tRNA ligase [Tautonia plasticadhaerens]
MSIAEQLPKQYDPQDAQARWYPFWVDRGYFHADPGRSAKPYAIVIPPPNVTGALHLGHALNNTLQDVLIRWRRMQGYDALWMPGTDHAGIATQAVVEKRLFTEEKKTRHDIGREALVNRIWAWKHEYEARILGQLRLMGCSCDWDRTRFTLDDMCARAVRVTFFNLFKAGKIFRGKRLVNWDTQLRTAVADDEIEYKDTEGHLWTIRYPVTGSDSESLQVSTTRPETMLGDTAVAVHPGDDRYKHLIGRTVDLPLTGMQIPIIADPILVDPKFGTGCVKVTPAHDPNDYQTGLRHGLPMVNLLNPDGTYNENANAYAGLDRREVRKRVVADLEAQGLLVKVEPYTNRVGYSDRSKTPIEPYLSDQWFVRMGDGEDGSPGFAQQAMDAVTSGRLKIHPERYAKSYLDWLGEKRDWCISRQLWWGHRIPIWHVGGTATCSEVDLKRAFAGRDDVTWRESESGGWLICALNDLDPKQLPGFAFQDLEQDPDVLDTWFSSALWPHSTLGWPEQTPELAKYYPTNVLSTARDIITLWVARMVIFGQFNMGDVPFKDVYIHPVIQDGDGKRMSKSAGNGVDPVDIIELYGADALRFTLASSATETQDLRMPVEPTMLPDGRTVNTSKKFEEGRTFPNKFWNASRFAMINLEGYDPEFLPGELQGTGPVDLWILGGLARTTREVTRAFESFQFAEASRILRDFTWNDFCDWYVELAKRPLRSEDAVTRQTTQHVLVTALDTLCRLLHPIIPFVTEQVWQALNQVAPRRKDPVALAAEPAAESVCVAPWPTFPDSWGWPQSDEWVAQLREKVTALRNLRADRNVPASAKIAPTIVASGRTAMILGPFTTDIMALTGAESLRIVEAFEKPGNAAVAVLPDAEIVLPMEGLIDPKVEVEKLAKSKLDLEKQLGGVRAKLGNASFVERAPAEVVRQQRDRLAELEAQHAAVASRLAELGG